MGILLEYERKESACRHDFPAVAEELRRIRTEQRYNSLRMGWRNEEDLICLGVNGAYLWHSGTSPTSYRDRQSGSFPNITLHGLRHTHASLLMEMASTRKVIKERLGHADATLTMDTTRMYCTLCSQIQQVSLNIYWKKKEPLNRAAPDKKRIFSDQLCNECAMAVWR